MRLDSPFRSIFPASLVKRGRHVTVPRVRRTPRINILRLARRIGGNRSANSLNLGMKFFDPWIRRRKQRRKGRRRNGAKKKKEATGGRYGGNQRRRPRGVAGYRLPGGYNRIKQRYLFFHPFKNVLKCKKASGRLRGGGSRDGGTRGMVGNTGISPEEAAEEEEKERERRWKRRRAEWRKVDEHENERGCWRRGMSGGGWGARRGPGGGWAATVRPGEVE